MYLFASSSDLQFKNCIKYPEIYIPENSFTFLTGKSGCGKSTYLKMLNRTVLPQNGSILYWGKDLKEYPILPYRREVLLVPQDVFLLDGTIRENFDLYYSSRGDSVLSNKEICHFLQICCSEFSPEDTCMKMSGGERQRVFQAIFLSLADKVLLLDEPTAALDEKTSDMFIQNIRQYCKQKKITVLCVSHSTKLAESYADTVIRLEEPNHE